jgi:hypothetical protein
MQDAFEEYLRAEEQNLGISTHNLGDLLNIFYVCDDLYRYPVKNTRALQTDDEILISIFFRFIIERLYVSVAHFLRCRFSDCLSSTRQAIDAGLSALKVIEDPTSVWKYANRDKCFVHIKDEAERRVANVQDPTPGSVEYILGRLVGFHDWCSRMGSHADLETVFLRRVKQPPGAEGSDQASSFCFFQVHDPDGFRYYFVHVVGYYFYVLKLFEMFWETRLAVDSAKWKQEIGDLAKTLDTLNVTLKPRSP